MVKHTHAAKSADERKAELKEIEELISSGVRDLLNSENYERYLTVMSQFHHYSLNNILLIFSQMPKATKVAGLRKWNSFGRTVKKGEKGIRIYAPSYKKKEVDVPQHDASGNLLKNSSGEVETKKETQVIPLYRLVSVFDVSQTEGDPLPEIAGELTAGVDDYKTLLDAIMSVCPVPVSFEDIRGEAKGYFSHGEGRIVVKTGMSESQSIKTLVHELTHSLLHKPGDGKSREAKEVEAESVAFAVCRHFGIDTGDYTFPYVASWSTTDKLDEFKASLSLIRDTASRIIEDVCSALGEEASEDVSEAV